MLKFITKLFGSSKSEKDVQKIRPILEKANSFFASYASLTNDELRGLPTFQKLRCDRFLQTGFLLPLQNLQSSILILNSSILILQF